MKNISLTMACTGIIGIMLGLSVAALCIYDIALKSNPVKIPGK